MIWIIVRDSIFRKIKIGEKCEMWGEMSTLTIRPKQLCFFALPMGKKLQLLYLIERVIKNVLNMSFVFHITIIIFPSETLMLTARFCQKPFVQCGENLCPS